MFFDTTKELIGAVSRFIDPDKMKVTEVSKDCSGQDRMYDCVWVDEQNNVGFNVFDGEIIVYSFGDHVHYEDYIRPPDEGEDDYVKRAKVYLEELFTCKFRHESHYSGNTLTKELNYTIFPDGREELTGGSLYPSPKAVNPYAEKRVIRFTYQYDASKSRFIIRSV